MGSRRAGAVVTAVFHSALAARVVGPALAGRAWNTLRGRSSAADTVPSCANEMKSK